MENISRGPTFGGFCHYPHREVDAGRHGCKTTEYKSTDSSLPRLLIEMYCERVSLWTVKMFLRNTKEKRVMGNLCISLNFSFSYNKVIFFFCLNVCQYCSKHDNSS
jgi:hypothetical protein